MKPAPLFTDTFALNQWLLGHFDAENSHLARRLCNTSLALLETITLALKNYLREERIIEADEQLIALRMQIRLAEACGALDERQLHHALDLTDRIGRQLGSWQRSLA